MTGNNNGGLLAGGFSYDVNGTLTNNGGCFGNNFNYLNDEIVGTGILNVTISKCSTYGQLTGNRSGGLCAMGIGQNSQSLTMTVKIYQCRNLSKTIGLSKNELKHKSKYTFKSKSTKYIKSSYCGGLLAGNVTTSNSETTPMSIVINNCYVVGKINIGCAGLVGSNQDGITQNNLTISNSYSGNNKKCLYPLGNSSQGLNIVNCYYGKTLKKITNSIGKLPKLYWKKTKHLPRLRNI